MGASTRRSNQIATLRKDNAFHRRLFACPASRKIYRCKRGDDVGPSLVLDRRGGPRLLASDCDSQVKVDSVCFQGSERVIDFRFSLRLSLGACVVGIELDDALDALESAGSMLNLENSV